MSTAQSNTDPIEAAAVHILVLQTQLSNAERLFTRVLQLHESKDAAGLDKLLEMLSQRAHRVQANRDEAGDEYRLASAPVSAPLQ